MIDLTKIFDYLFLDLRISFENKQKGSDLHIGKLHAQNTVHQYDTMIAATEAVHLTFFGVLPQITLKLGTQIAQTSVVDVIIDDFRNRCSRLNFYFLSIKFETNPLYHVFFPLGMMEYTQHTNKGNAENYIGAMVLAITNHTTEAGGVSVLHEFEAFQTRWEADRLLQTTDIGLTKSERDTRNDAEVAWAAQMQSNLFNLALEFIGQPEKMYLFFSQQYFQQHRSSASEHVGTLTGTAFRGHTIVPEPEVLVHVVDGNIADVYTKADGTFRTHHLKDGFYKVQFSKPGFITQEMTIEIKNNADTICDVMMEMSTQEVS